MFYLPRESAKADPRGPFDSLSVLLRYMMDFLSFKNRPNASKTVPLGVLNISVQIKRTTNYDDGLIDRAIFRGGGYPKIEDQIAGNVQIILTVS